MGRGQAGAQRTSRRRHRGCRPPAPASRSLCPRPCVCSSWEIYGGSINGFYRQLLERAEQGWAVGGPSRRLTAKTLKYYGPTYIKTVLCTSSAPSPLLTQEQGLWPENSGCFQSTGLARDKMPTTPCSSPCSRGQEPLAGLAARRQRGDWSKQPAVPGLRRPPPPPPWPPVLRLSLPPPGSLRAWLMLFSLP